VPRGVEQDKKWHRPSACDCCDEQDKMWHRHSACDCYSCAGICVSESRQALNLSLRQTQHKPSVDVGAHCSPQTIQGLSFSARPASSILRVSSINASGIKASGEADLGTETSPVAFEDAAGTGRRLRFTVPL
jgi:hypothetical protein